MRRAGLPLAAAALVLLPPLLVHAGQTITVLQASRSFSVKEVRIKRGDTLRFQNADTFLHQVGASAPGFAFASPEQEPGQSLEVRFPVTGQFTVRCEIHPRMALAVTVD